MRMVLEVEGPDASCAYWDEEASRWTDEGVETVARIEPSFLVCATRPGSWVSRLQIPKGVGADVHLGTHMNPRSTNLPLEIALETAWKVSSCTSLRHLSIFGGVLSAIVGNVILALPLVLTIKVADPLEMQHLRQSDGPGGLSQAVGSPLAAEPRWRGEQRAAAVQPAGHLDGHALGLRLRRPSVVGAPGASSLPCRAGSRVERWLVVQ
eukprot:Skav213839  [mRNA]  locus=scaffold315:191015:192130:+ [translate_table: standard]